MIINGKVVSSRKGGKDMKELKISKEAVLEASKKCPDAKEVLKVLFPGVFKDEWVEITEKCEWKLREYKSGYAVRCMYDSYVLFRLEADGIVCPGGHPLKIKMEEANGSYCIFEKRASK